MKKLFTVALLLLLVACSSEGEISDVQKEQFEDAILEIKNAEAISISIEDRSDSKYVLKEGGETKTSISHIAYRSHQQLKDLAYVKDMSTTHNVDFEQSTWADLSFIKEGSLHTLNGSEVTLDRNLTEDALNDLGIDFIKVVDEFDFTNVIVKESKDKLIYNFAPDALNFKPILNIGDSFSIAEGSEVSISEYTFVIEKGHVTHIAFIYNVKTESLESVVNVSLKVNALNDDVVIQYVDVEL